MSNMYLSFATFRETSKKVSETVRESVGHNSPRASSGWIRFYRYGVPVLLIAGVGGLALGGYAVATVAASQIAAGATTGVGMSSVVTTGIGWTSSVLIPAGTLITNLWWNKKVPSKIRETLQSDPAYIVDIDATFPDLAELERFGHDDTLKTFLEHATNIGQQIGQQIVLQSMLQLQIRLRYKCE